MLASAIALSYLASEFTVLPFDLKSYHELPEEANPLFSILMEVVSYLGDASIAMALIVMTAATFALRGHVLFFVIFFGFLAYLAWIHFAGRVRVILIATCAALIVLIGPSRIFLGAHWASDVAGGYIIGALWLFVLILLYQRAIR